MRVETCPQINTAALYSRLRSVISAAVVGSCACPTPQSAAERGVHVLGAVAAAGWPNKLPRQGLRCLPTSSVPWTRVDAALCARLHQSACNEERAKQPFGGRVRMDCAPCRSGTDSLGKLRTGAGMGCAPDSLRFIATSSRRLNRCHCHRCALPICCERRSPNPHTLHRMSPR
ncbi:uncharacterized protein CC84DRAFT_165332 [Paraphaeosphaeria sporulosa]|uniref:Uncharacterized protein n=1 Tax=Paraphaeosphaeria sporulosa TaxID=1460663 RepID=A0A177CZD1_9PLEO|nr:uncharacterized protein CC84DRAFT_165332 [Paraphaeosphaeria sporulosa]OAG12885.1 hypothetical protein CC84DRAFT_165332 [Paraphaeosphaeria sporulosa]